VADARDRQWDILRDACGLPVAAGAERRAAVADDLPRGRPAAQGFGKCGATTRHSVSVRSSGIV